MKRQKLNEKKRALGLINCVFFIWKRELTLRENTAAYHRIWLRPRVLRDVKNVDMRTTILGVPTRLPLYVT